MVRRSTWILLIIFAFLVGFAWLFQHNQANKTVNVATTTPTASLKNLYGLNSTQINEIKITDTARAAIDLYRVPSSSNWAIANLPVDQADSIQIASISAQLISLQAQETFTQTLPLDSIGLATPGYTITMTTSDGTQLITYVGSQTAIGSGYYVRVDSGQPVIVDKVMLDGILNMLKSPPLKPTATPEITPTETTVPTGLGVQDTPTP